MDIARELRRARRRAGLSQRELAARAGTSQATISAYESGRKRPSILVLERLLRTSGAELRVVDAPGRRSVADLERSGRRLAEVLTLAEALPYRPSRRRRFPRLPTGTGR
ncbi:MAG: helix-turn-helix transcriptional regulator [Thermoleophilaceae bacterium]